jgi:transcription-repair coupling factor (superfamily II helicase)
MNDILEFKLNDSLIYTEFLLGLINLNYKRVEMVLERGTFCVRGSVIDVFCLNYTDPVRIEFDLDRVVRINYFNIYDQLCNSDLTNIKILKFIDSNLLSHTNISKNYLDNNVISDIEIGDYVVHEEFGVGIFDGLMYKIFNSYQGEFFKIIYKNNDLVFIPVDQLHKIYKYSQAEVVPKLNSLNDSRWGTQKKNAVIDMLGFADALFETYKQRQIQKGFSFCPDSELQLVIENDFKYKFSIDQERAMNEIKSDMESDKPMQRLLCGDVGFGKTELLVRATLKALESGKQVAVLVPTTILAQQHFDVFSDRLANTPYIVKSLSRFNSKKEQLNSLKQLKLNQCDCVIGTHRLLSKDVLFFDLGLLIIDEEHRFGVSDKEKIQSIRKNIDILTVSATPIPRTLYMSLGGSYNISLIETPPKSRLPIITHTSSFDVTRLINAFEYEISRGGQLFYVFNNIGQIQKKALEIQSLSPLIKIKFIHGKMNELSIKSILLDFKQGKFNCLLSTTIIENGIDISNANTIIIDSIENFGLAQIHQIRGRVGRSNRQAYAYLFHKPLQLLNEKSKKRIQAVKEYVNLGAGYDIALRDLEIRGSGSILGPKQHGHIVSIGFRYYCKLLEECFNSKKGIEQQPSYLSLETKFITISESYIPNARERMSFYLKFVRCDSIEGLDSLKKQLSDRYGRPDTNLINTFNYIKLKLLEGRT